LSFFQNVQKKKPVLLSYILQSSSFD